MGEVRVSPDGNAVAIKRDMPEDSPMLWGVMTKTNGGHYGGANEVASWAVVPESEVEPEG